MKSSNSLWAAGLAALALMCALPSIASADHCRQSQSRCSRCGGPIISTYAVVGYDRCGHPIYSWVPAVHRCAVQNYYPSIRYPGPGYYGRSYGPSYGYRSGYGNGCRSGGGYYGRPSCPPSRGGFSITFGF